MNSDKIELQEDISAPSLENLPEEKESKCLHILNLQRPFVSQSLEALLSKYGKIVRFWLDFIKTNSYVEVIKAIHFKYKIIDKK